MLLYTQYILQDPYWVRQKKFGLFISQLGGVVATTVQYDAILNVEGHASHLSDLFNNVSPSPPLVPLLALALARNLSLPTQLYNSRSLI